MPENETALPLDHEFPSLAYRDRMLTELQENGRVRWPNGWPLSLLLDLLTTLGIDPKDVQMHRESVVVMRRV